MIYYVFDLYPRLDPVNGARLVRFSSLQEMEYRGEANGTGMGKFTLRGTDADAASIDPKGMQYVRVVRVNDAVVDASTTSGFSEAVVGGFFIEYGDYQALDANSTKKLTLGGAGPLSYLARAVMDWQSHLTTPFTGSDPFDDIWRLWNAGTGNALGQILWRVIRELKEAGRSQSPIPDVTLDFDYTEDSNGAAWSASSGDFTAQVLANVLTDPVKRLMELGLYVELDPDTFVLSAYEPDTHSRDRTGLAWASNVVRFQSPTDGTGPTGNIKSDAKRGITARIKRSAILVGANDAYQWVTDATADLVWEGGYRLEDEDGTARANAGTQQLNARDDAGDMVQLRMKIGNDEANGKYLPFEHVRPDDRVTLHTGSGQWDWNETEQRVFAISIKKRQGGDWDAWVDLGAQYASFEQRQFQAQPVGAHTHPMRPELCRIPIAGSAETETVLLSFDWDDAAQEPIPEWPTLSQAASDTNITAFVSGANGTPWGGRSGAAGETISDPGNATHPASPGQKIRYRGWVRERNDNALGDVSLSVQFYAGSFGSYVAVGDPVNIISGTGFASWTQFGPVDLIVPDGVTAAGVSYLGKVDELEIATVAAGFAGHAGDGHADLVGTSIRAKRCDATEHALRAVDPTVTDDADDGYPVGTHWINTVSGAQWMLTDNTAGAAVWLALGGGSSGIAVEDEGVEQGTTIDRFDFTGAGVTASVSGTQATVNIPGGGAGSILGQPSGTLDRTYTFDSTVESWTTDAGTLSSTSSRLRLDRSGGSNATALEPSGVSSVTNGEIQFDFYSVSGTDCGIVFRATDASNHYMIALRLIGSANGVELFKKVTGAYTSLGTLGTGYRPMDVGAQTKILVRWTGEQVTLYINEGFIGQWLLDGSHSAGRCGIRADTSIMEVDNYKVYTL